VSYFANFTEILTNEKSELMICRLFIGQKFRKKFTPTPALYPSSKISDSGGGDVARKTREFLLTLPHDFYPPPWVGDFRW